MTVNPVTPFTLPQGILNPFCFITPQHKVKLPVTIFSFLLCHTEIQCLVGSWINVLELSLRPLEAWGSRALSIENRIYRHPHHQHKHVKNISLSTTSLLPRLITALIYQLEHNSLQRSTLIKTSACLKISLTSSINLNFHFWRHN